MAGKPTVPCVPARGLGVRPRPAERPVTGNVGTIRCARPMHGTSVSPSPSRSRRSIMNSSSGSSSCATTCYDDPVGRNPYLILRGAIGRQQAYFTGALAAPVAGPSSRSVVGSPARTSERLPDPRTQACRGGEENRTRPLAGILSLSTNPTETLVVLSAARPLTQSHSRHL
jgi:hypothetical protein